MFYQIAFGTMIGVLGAVLVLFFLYKLRQYTLTVAGKKQLRSFFIAIVTMISIFSLGWITAPKAYKEIRKIQHRTAAKKRAKEDKIYCQAQKRKIIERAVSPLTEPIGFMRINRIRHKYRRTSIGGFSDGVRYRTAHGWLTYCSDLGVLTPGEFAQALKLQKKNQLRYDKPELDKKKLFDNKLNEMSRKLLNLPQ